MMLKCLVTRCIPVIGALTFVEAFLPGSSSSTPNPASHAFETQRFFQDGHAFQAEEEQSAIEGMRREFRERQVELKLDLLEQKSSARIRDAAAKVLETKLRLTAAEIEYWEDEAITAYNEMQRAMREVRTAFSLADRAETEADQGDDDHDDDDEASWLLDDGTDESTTRHRTDDTLQSLVLADRSGGNNGAPRRQQQQQEEVIKTRALCRRVVFARNRLWSSRRERERLQRLRDDHSEDARRRWAVRVSERASAVDAVRRELATRHEIV